MKLDAAPLSCPFRLMVIIVDLQTQETMLVSLTIILASKLTENGLRGMIVAVED